MPVILLLTLVTGCSSKASTIPVPLLLKPAIPATLISPLKIPEFKGKTNGDLADYLFDLLELLEKAEADRAALRKLQAGG